jgi:hypothetical protein
VGHGGGHYQCVMVLEMHGGEGGGLGDVRLCNEGRKGDGWSLI